MICSSVNRFLFIVRLHLLGRTLNLSGGNLQWQVSGSEDQSVNLTTALAEVLFFEWNQVPLNQFDEPMLTFAQASPAKLLPKAATKVVGSVWFTLHSAMGVSECILPNKSFSE